MIVDPLHMSDCGLPRRFVPALAAAIAFVFVDCAAAEESKTYGSAFLEPQFSAGQAPRNVVKLRYRCEVTENRCSDPEMWKIIFVFHFFQGADPAKGYELQSNLYSWRFAYPNLSKRSRTGEVPGLKLHPGETGVFLSVPDNHKDRRVGARSRVPTVFPALDQEIDGFPDLWKREHVAQENLTGKEIAIEISRGAHAERLTGWNARDELPAREYRLWTMHATWDGQSRAVDFVLPAKSAEFYAPGRMLQIATEAFAIHPGRMTAYFWAFEFQREGSETWEPLRKWKLVNTDAKAGENTWGMRAATHRGQSAIEVSNSGERNYAEKNEIISLEAR